MRRTVAGVAAAVTAVGLTIVVGPADATIDATDRTATTAETAATAVSDYVVLYERGADRALARADIAKAGGTVVSENATVGYALVRSTKASFPAGVAASSAVEGAARNRIIGQAPSGARSSRDEVEKLAAEREAAKGTLVAAAPAAAAPAPAEPLAHRQWDMRQIGATPAGSYAKQPGKKTVLVGIIDTGVDGSHPDIAPNFDRALSRNFVTDLPDIDDPADTGCEFPSCVDPVDHDDDGHGTHVASTIGSPVNGLGIAGVAPNVTLVNIRAGQDSGYFFLAPTLAALTYAGDIGVDVVNMSYYVDPWLYNCRSNPADSPAEQQEQRIVREATQRALDYARNRQVTLVSSMGNGATDLGRPTVDDSSPDYPEGNAKVRQVDNSCITVPTENRGVIAVSATGPSTRKAYYSDYGTEQTDVAAPGGDVYDTPDTTRSAAAGILAAYPKRLAELNGELNEDGTPNTPFVVQDCQNGVCGYYQYLQGTSMAAPHATGVAALIVSQYGRNDPRHPGVTLSPPTTEVMLLNSATETACPSPRSYAYSRILVSGAVSTATHRCEGGPANNGFYGRGIVNAYAAVGGK